MLELLTAEPFSQSNFAGFLEIASTHIKQSCRSGRQILLDQIARMDAIERSVYAAWVPYHIRRRYIGTWKTKFGFKVNLNKDKYKN